MPTSHLTPLSCGVPLAPWEPQLWAHGPSCPVLGMGGEECLPLCATTAEGLNFG